jgi:sporulation protein YlmC with PRC-barrel domain
MSKEKEKKAMTKDRLIGMKVIDSEGNDAGTVQDIAFTVGKMGMTLIVETKKGETKEVPWEEIQAAGDYVLLKASTA